MKVFQLIPISIVLVLVHIQCDMTDTCASCIDPDFTIFVFDGFTQNEIDSFYIIGFPRGDLNNPLDTTELLIQQNQFFLNRGVFGNSTLTNDYIVEGVNREFRFEITDLDYTIRVAKNNCRCDVVENKSLRVNGDLIPLPDPFEPVILQK